MGAEADAWDGQVLVAESLEARLAATAPLVQQDSETAAEALRALVDDAAEADDVSVEAEAAYLCARAEVNNGRLDEALNLIDLARRRWMATGARLSALRTDLGRMHVLDDLGRHAEGLEIGRALIAAVENAEVDPSDVDQAAWLRAAALENVGVGHGYLGDHARALEAYAEAEAAYRELGWEEDIPRPMGNRGVELVELGRYAAAVDVLQEAGGGFKANDDRLSAAKCLAYEARAHVMLGDHLAAAGATARAERFLAGLTTSTEYARTQLVRAETLRWLNLFEESLDLYEAMIPRFREAGLRHDLADASYGAGLVLASIGRLDDAETRLAEAQQLFDVVGSDPMRAACMVAQAQLSPEDDAAILCTTALGLLAGTGRTAETVAARIRLAQVAENAGDGRRELLAAEQALGSNPSPELAWRLRYEWGRWHHRQGDLDAARVAYSRALDSIEQMRDTLAAEHHRLLFVSSRSEVVDELVALELEAGNVDVALQHSERARARTLVERITGTLGAASPIPSAELDEIYTELLVTPKAAAAGLLDRARALERMSLATPSLPAVERAHPAPADRAVDAAISYHTIGDEVMAFLDVGGETTAVRELSRIGEVRSLVQQLEAQWRRFEDPGLAARQHSHLLGATVDILQQLYIRLLAGIPDVSGGLDSVLIIPCAPLGNVPFAALHDGTSHMVEQLTMTLAPSREVALHAATRLRSDHRRRLALGVPDEMAPHVAVEVRAVGEIASDATVLIGEEATRRVLIDRAADADVLHLACHGIERRDSPLFSALRLGDGWLTAADVAALELDGQLVILSACSSGRQSRQGLAGEAVGLPRAFLAAGAGGVVVNLWQVNDVSAGQLMTELHRNLATQPPSEALRTAQLSVLSNRPHPYHWGATALYGGFSPKEQS